MKNGFIYADMNLSIHFGLVLVSFISTLTSAINRNAGLFYKGLGHSLVTVEFNGHKGFIVYANQSVHNKNNEMLWCWSMEFPFGTEERLGVVDLLNKGYSYAHMGVGNTFGSDTALKKLDMFHEVMVKRNFTKKAILIGLSRGAFYAYRYAIHHPENVAVIYGDSPVCSYLSWPKKIDEKNWNLLLQAYNFSDNSEAETFEDVPLSDKALELYKTYNISMINVVGDTDQIVPVAENTNILAEKYRRIGGNIVVIHKQHDGHTPHGLDDASPIVDFILSHSPVPN